MVSYIFAFLTAAAAAVSDYRRGIIHTRMLLFLFLFHFLILFQNGDFSLVRWLGGMLLPLLIFFPFWMLHKFGAGDVKLLMCLGSMLGPEEILPCIWYSLFLAGCYSLVDSIIHGSFCHSIRFAVPVLGGFLLLLSFQCN